MVLRSPILDRRRLEFPALITVTGWLRHRECAVQSERCIGFFAELSPEIHLNL